MKYMLLIYNDPSVYATMSEEDQGTEFQAYMQFSEEVHNRGILETAMQLQPVEAATTVRVRDGKTATFDGPFAETKETLGGVYVLECENLDEAIEWAAKIPSALHSSVEVRPIMGQSN